MGVENVVYGLIAGIAFVLLGFAWRPREGGRPTTNDERIEMLLWVLAAWFCIVVLQFAGAGAPFALVTSVAGGVLLLYLVGRRLIRRSHP
jgi:hypothetical protein